MGPFKCFPTTPFPFTLSVSLSTLPSKVCRRHFTGCCIPLGVFTPGSSFYTNEQRVPLASFDYVLASRAATVQSRREERV